MLPVRGQLFSHLVFKSPLSCGSSMIPENSSTMNSRLVDRRLCSCFIQYLSVSYTFMFIKICLFSFWSALSHRFSPCHPNSINISFPRKHIAYWRKLFMSLEEVNFWTFIMLMLKVSVIIYFNGGLIFMASFAVLYGNLLIIYKLSSVHSCFEKKKETRKTHWDVKSEL